VDHGISQEFMGEVFAESKKFFDLPYNEKMKLLRDEKNRGYTPMLDEILDPENQVNGKLFKLDMVAAHNFTFHVSYTC
jgi:isopenicillin N synthase-like dioxygenase